MDPFSRYLLALHLAFAMPDAPPAIFTPPGVPSPSAPGAVHVAPSPSPATPAVIHAPPLAGGSTPAAIIVGGVNNGLLLPQNGTANGKLTFGTGTSIYTSNHFIQWNGSFWDLYVDTYFVGNGVGNTTYPWEANWASYNPFDVDETSVSSLTTPPAIHSPPGRTPGTPGAIHSAPARTPGTPPVITP